MTYVPASIYFGEMTGNIIGKIIGYLIVLLFKAAFWTLIGALAAVYGIFIGTMKVLEFILKLMKAGYHQYSLYRERKQC